MKGRKSMLVTALRVAIMYAFVVLCLRIMGKRQIAELEPSELVVTIIISDIATDPIIDPGKPFVTAIIAITILIFFEVILSFLAYKNINIRSLLYGKPSTFFSDGKINQKEMENQRFSIGDLLEEVRNNGAASLKEVEHIVMETNGNVSVILNADNRPLTPADMGIKAPDTEMSYIIIDNGSVVGGNLKRLNINKAWINERLKKEGIRRISDVFYMGADKSGHTVVIKKDVKSIR